MTHSEHKKTLIALMDQAGVVVNTSPAPSMIREGQSAARYNFNVYSTESHGRVHYAGTYSMGWGCFKPGDLPRVKCYGGSRRPPMARENAFRLLTTGRDGSPVVQDIRRHANNKRKPEPVQVFRSLLREAFDSDQDFATWASDFGYSDDSMKAKTLWEEGNAARRFLKSTIPTETLAAMYDVASEI